MRTERAIGRWTMTGLVINCIIGSAIFGVPSEAIRLVGYLSPLAMVVAAVLMVIIMLPIAEVASQFSEPGGLYLYARTAFGRFAGLQIGWFWILAIVGGGAANANLFLTYLAPFVPDVTHGATRAAALVLLVVIPTATNYVGVRQGAHLSVLFTLAKLVPLTLVIGLGLWEWNRTAAAHQEIAMIAPAWSAWPKVLLILVYAFSGWEDTLAPAGEVKQPRRTVPFALCLGLAICAIIYTLFQLVIVHVIGTNATERPVMEAATALVGNRAGVLVSVAVMLSTFGWLSGSFLNAPRFPVALAEQGDGPKQFGRLHPRFGTPSVGILLYGCAVLILAVTGTFLWAIAVTAGALVIFYSVACAALIRLRKTQPEAPAFRVPFGRVFAVAGIAVAAALLTQLELRQLALMSVTAVIAAANWVWSRRNERQLARADEQSRMA